MIWVFLSSSYKSIITSNLLFHCCVVNHIKKCFKSSFYKSITTLIKQCVKFDCSQSLKSVPEKKTEFNFCCKINLLQKWTKLKLKMKIVFSSVLLFCLFLDHSLVFGANRSVTPTESWKSFQMSKATSRFTIVGAHFFISSQFI